MKQQLTEEQRSRLAQLVENPPTDMAGLLAALPPYVDIYRYQPEDRWENMSDPTFAEWLTIQKCLTRVYNGEKWRCVVAWECQYGDGFKRQNPDMQLYSLNEELVDALYKLYVAYLTAPEEWVKKEAPEHVRRLGEPPLTD